MDLSIVIPVYNGAKLLTRCLDSVFEQNTHYSFEVIIVDDGSFDNSVDIVKKRKETNIILLQQMNAGPATARNRGVEAAHGKYVAYLDADDYWNNGYIEKTVHFLQQHHECVAVTVGQQITNTKGTFLAPEEWVRTKNDFVIDNFYEEWAKTQFVGTCSTTMVRKSVINIGGQRLGMRSMEDWNFWFRLATQGQWGFIHDVLYVSDGSSTSLSNDEWLKRMRNRWRLTPTVDEWQKDILALFPQNQAPNGYHKALAGIVRPMAYAHLLDGRFELARRETLMYGKDFPLDSIGRLMNLFKKHRYLWACLCQILRWREYHRYSVKG